MEDLAEVVSMHVGRIRKHTDAVWKTALGGWHFRVLRENDVKVGAILRLPQRPHPGWTVARVLRASRGVSSDERLAARN